MHTKVPFHSNEFIITSFTLGSSNTAMFAEVPSAICIVVSMNAFMEKSHRNTTQTFRLTQNAIPFCKQQFSSQHSCDIFFFVFIYTFMIFWSFVSNRSPSVDIVTCWWMRPKLTFVLSEKRLVCICRLCICCNWSALISHRRMSRCDSSQLCLTETLLQNIKQTILILFYWLKPKQTKQFT